MTQLTAAPAALAPQRAVLSPLLDAALVGGVSVVVVLAFAASGVFSSTEPLLERFAVITAIVNWPHFLASYALLYGAREAVHRYRSVSMVAPAALVIWAVAGLVLHGANPAILKLLYVLSAVLLAWHYTGQTFGMMASFSYVDGLFFDGVERKLVRANLLVLLGWHLVWALELEVRQGGVNAAAEAALGTALRWATPVAAASMLLGAAGLARLWRRTGRRPGVRVVLPWLAVHGWYALMAVDPRAILLAQFSHSVQYLAFPLRVHLNRVEAETPGSSPLLRAAIYLGLLVIAGQAVFVGLPWLLARGVEAAGWIVPPVALAVTAVVNVHHYLVDGVVWKLSNPKVRKDLFAHLGKA